MSNAISRSSKIMGATTVTCSIAEIVGKRTLRISRKEFVFLVTPLSAKNATATLILSLDLCPATQTTGG
jgi:hypothetical protein